MKRVFPSNRIRFALAATLAVLPALPLFAGLSSANMNYVNDLVGDRATGFGGAFTAISDDPSGAYYNPAGLSFASDNQISLSVNTYKVKTVTYKNAIGNSNNYTQNLQSFYPSFFGVVQSIGDYKIAFTFINMNNEILDQDSKFKGVTFQGASGPVKDLNYALNYNNTDNTLLAGLSLASFFTKSFTWGASLHYQRRRQEQILNQVISSKGSAPGTSTTDPDNAIYQQTTNYITDESNAFTPRVGFQFMPSSFMSLGLSGSKGFLMSYDRDQRGTQNNKQPTVKKSDLSGQADLPIEVRGGVAVFPSKKFLWSFDVIGHQGDQNYTTTTNDLTLNFATGAEYYLTNSLPFRAGIFTNRAATPSVQAGKKGQDQNIDLYGLSLSISWQTRNSSITLGGFYQANFFGDGKAQVTDTGSIQKFDANMFQIGLTGSARY